MPSVAVPTTGDITLAHITAAFPGVTSPGSLLSYLGVHPSAPSTGSIDMLSFRGLNAVSPTHSAATLYDTGVLGTAKATAILGASSLGVSTAAGGTLALALNLKTYLTNAAYQGTVTYAASPALPTGVTLNAASGVLSVDPATVNIGTSALAYTRTITATNKWGNTSALAVTFNFAATSSPASTTGVTPPGNPSFAIRDTLVNGFKTIGYLGLNGGTVVIYASSRQYLLVSKADLYNPSGYTMYAIKDVATGNYMRHFGNQIKFDPYVGNNYDFSWRFDTVKDSPLYTIWNYYGNGMNGLGCYVGINASEIAVIDQTITSANAAAAKKWEIIPGP
jgi:hypothetical protein